jgi:type IV pilus assembly protein PilF
MKLVRNVIWLSACWIAVLMAGCAASPGGESGPGGRADIMTESDEDQCGAG